VFFNIEICCQESLPLTCSPFSSNCLKLKNLIYCFYFIAADNAYVYREKAKALEVLKQHKEARLKEFSNEDDAIEYAQTGFEIVQTKYNDVKSNYDFFIFLIPNL